VLVLVASAGADPTATIGVGAVELPVESEPDEGVAGGGFWPLGITMGVDLASDPFLSLPVLESNWGGQSTAVGGQLSVLSEPEDESGGGHPAPAPKSPDVVQSALAMPTGTTAIHPANEIAAAARHNRDVFTASGCPRRR
jgi:hypothetical protein